MNKRLDKLRSMSPEDLRKRIAELDLVIMKGCGNIAIGNPFSRKGEGDTAGMFVNAKREKARILTILNQRKVAVTHEEGPQEIFGFWKRKGRG